MGRTEQGAQRAVRAGSLCGHGASSEGLSQRLRRCLRAGPQGLRGWYSPTTSRLSLVERCLCCEQAPLDVVPSGRTHRITWTNSPTGFNRKAQAPRKTLSPQQTRTAGHPTRCLSGKRYGQGSASIGSVPQSMRIRGAPPRRAPSGAVSQCWTADFPVHSKPHENHDLLFPHGDTRDLCRACATWWASHPRARSAG